VSRSPFLRGEREGAEKQSLFFFDRKVGENGKSDFDGTISIRRRRPRKLRGRRALREEGRWPPLSFPINSVKSV
jgi:hypothetical protein